MESDQNENIDWNAAFEQVDFDAVVDAVQRKESQDSPSGKLERDKKAPISKTKATSKKKSRKKQQGENETPPKPAEMSKKKNKGGNEKVIKKKAKLSDTEANELVLEYMLAENRPFNSTKVFENLNNALPHSQVKSALQKLVKMKKICEKLDGRAVLYSLNQMLIMGKLDQSLEQELAACDSKIKSLSETLNINQTRFEQLQQDLIEVSQTIANTELETVFKRLQRENKKLALLRTERSQTDLNLLTANKTAEELKSESSFFLRTWNILRGNVCNAAENLHEIAGIKMSDLFAMAGIDDDKDCGFEKLPKNVDSMIQKHSLPSVN